MMVFDPKKLLDDLLGSQIPGTQGTVRDKAGQAAQLAKDNPLATGALVAVLLGTGAGRQLTGSALKIGGLAAVAGLAYKAYQNYQTGKEPGAAQPPQQAETLALPAPTDTPFDPKLAPQGETEFALVLVRAMIAAARADGHIDEAERGRIGDKLRLSGMDREEGAFLLAELERPVDLDKLVAEAGTEAQKAELYTAARLAIDPNTRAERGFLDLLAGRLKLPDALVDHIEATVAEVKA
jgi:uncharacterized membrane protein YebE (DUF533 family)